MKFKFLYVNVSEESDAFLYDFTSFKVEEVLCCFIIIIIIIIHIFHIFINSIFKF
jgi:hypothetical protein